MTTEVTFGVLFWVLVGVMLVIRGFFAVRVRRAGERLMPDRAAVEREGRAMFALRVVAFFVLIGWLVLYGVHPAWLRSVEFPLPVWLRWPGFFLGLAGLALLAWTEAVLGRHWSAQLQLREAHRLVTAGPYARVRHPLYTSGLMWTGALALVTANWVFVAIAVLVAAGLVLRLPREEQMLIDQFGDEYRAYMRRTGRFLPAL